jgi:1-aminocyclopropane-1-carboxylate deaminase
MHSWKKGSPIIKDADIDMALVPQTRVSPWRSLGPQAPSIYLKHEDEGRFAITANKLRKFASILPQLREAGIRQAVVIGSANSNNVVAACQLLLQEGIRPLPFLKKTAAAGTNQFLLRLLVDESDWQLIDHQDWRQVHEIAAIFVQEQYSMGVPTFLITEGACQAAALPGAMTLADDVVRNQAELGIQFSDIFIDAGTGMSAAALAIGLAEFGLQPRIHVTLMADPEEIFWEKAAEFDQWYQAIFEPSAPTWQQLIKLHKPKFAASFGSVNAQVLHAIRDYAKLGHFTDPIYSAKHLATAEQLISESTGEMSNVLIIHSGGAQALPGFEHRLFPQS